MEVKSLKLSAKEAKSRFKNGYWQNFCANRDKEIELALESGYDVNSIKTKLIKAAKNEIKMKYDSLSEDDILYKEVCEMLSSGEIILNPIKRLINNQVYDELSESEKQEYVIRLGTKYQEMRERYYQENA